MERCDATRRCCAIGPPPLPPSTCPLSSIPLALSLTPQHTQALWPYDASRLAFSRRAHSDLTHVTCIQHGHLQCRRACSAGRLPAAEPPPALHLHLHL